MDTQKTTPSVNLSLRVLPRRRECSNNKVNDRGERIYAPPALSKPEFGTGETDKYQWPVVDWKKWRTKNADEHGFLKEIAQGDSLYITPNIELPVGTIIIRYGPPSGNFSAPEGSSYDQLGLPYSQKTVEFHKYKVMNDGVEVEIMIDNISQIQVWGNNTKLLTSVDKGIVAPMFESAGGAVQYHHTTFTISQLVKLGCLQEVIE